MWKSDKKFWLNGLILMNHKPEGTIKYNTLQTGFSPAVTQGCKMSELSLYLFFWLKFQFPPFFLHPPPPTASF